MARSSGTFDTESGRAANRARLAKTPPSQLTTAATAASPASLDHWITKVREEHQDASERDVERMAEARRSEYFAQLARRRHARAG
jgi:hypothetical protein